MLAVTTLIIELAEREKASKEIRFTPRSSFLHKSLLLFCLSLSLCSASFSYFFPRLPSAENFLFFIGSDNKANRLRQARIKLFFLSFPFYSDFFDHFYRLFSFFLPWGEIGHLGFVSAPSSPLTSPVEKKGPFFHPLPPLKTGSPLKVSELMSVYALLLK